MQEEAVMAQLTELFQDLFDDDDLVPTRATTAHDVPGWDSIRHISLIVAVEHRFGITLTSGEMEGLKSVGDLADLIARKTG